MKNVLLLLVIIASFYAYSCSKSDSQNFKLLTGATWQSDSLLVNGARFLHLPQLFEGLTAVEVRVQVIRVERKQRPVLDNGFVELPGFRVLHGEAVTREAVLRVLRRKVLKDLDAIGVVAMIREREQVLVAAPVMPGQPQLGQPVRR